MKGQHRIRWSAEIFSFTKVIALNFGHWFQKEIKVFPLRNKSSLIVQVLVTNLFTFLIIVIDLGERKGHYFSLIFIYLYKYS